MQTNHSIGILTTVCLFLANAATARAQGTATITVDNSNTAGMPNTPNGDVIVCGGDTQVVPGQNTTVNNNKLTVSVQLAVLVNGSYMNQGAAVVGTFTPSSPCTPLKGTWSAPQFSRLAAGTYQVTATISCNLTPAPLLGNPYSANSKKQGITFQ